MLLGVVGLLSLDHLVVPQRVELVHVALGVEHAARLGDQAATCIVIELMLIVGLVVERVVD